MMRSELRDKVAELLMEAIQHRERSLLIFWLRAYCTIAERQASSSVSFSQLAGFVRRHHREIRWCWRSREAWGRRLVTHSGLFRAGDPETVAIAPQYQKDLPLICGKADAYWEFLKAVHRRRYSEGLRGVLHRAALLWKHRLFFEFHEMLEEVWMDWRGPERRFLQGLIQLGVAFYHIQRNNHRGAMSMFRNGQVKVAPHAPRYCGVELGKFLERIEKCRGLLEGLGPGLSHYFDWSLLPELDVSH